MVIWMREGKKTKEEEKMKRLYRNDMEVGRFIRNTVIFPEIEFPMAENPVKLLRREKEEGRDPDSRLLSSPREITEPPAHETPAHPKMQGSPFNQLEL